MNADCSAAPSFAEQWNRFFRIRGRLVLGAMLLGSPVLTQAAAPVVQLRGTIKDISSSGNKSKGEASFELNATEEQYSLRVIEADISPSLAGYYVSNLHDIFSSFVAVRPDDPKSIPFNPMPSLGIFRRGSQPLENSDFRRTPRANVLAYTYLATRLPKSGKDDAEFSEKMNPQLVTAAAKFEDSDFQTQVVRRPDGGLERVNFWGLRPGTSLKTFENTKDTFLLASLVIKESVDTMPVAGVFTVLGKRPGLTGKIVSFERRRYEFSGTIGSATDKDAFGWLTYYPGPVPPAFALRDGKNVTVWDYRFLAEDGGQKRIHGLNRATEPPFAKDKLPKWILDPRSPASDEVRGEVEKLAP